MKARDWNIPRKKEISVSEIDPFCVESVAPIFPQEIKTPHFHVMENNAVLALRPRKCIIDRRRFSAKYDRDASME